MRLSSRYSSLVSAGISDGTTFNDLPEQLTEVVIDEVLQMHNAGQPVLLPEILQHKLC